MKILLMIVTVIIFLSEIGFGQTIFLKNSFFGGYSFSTDSLNYEKVDTDTLSVLMKNNDEALKLLDSYSTNHTVSTVFGYAGGFLVGWPLGGSLASGEWKDGYTTMLLVGGGLVIVSIIFDSIANNKLEEAVNAHNNNLLSGLRRYKIDIEFNSVTQNISLNVRYAL